MYCLVYITAASAAEGADLARTLVAERLLACANLVPGVRSFYWWDGQVQDDQEVLVLGKTRRDLLERLIARARELHSYNVPCITAVDLAAGNPAYLDWVRRETGG